MNIFRRGLLAWALALPIWAVLLVMSFSSRSFIQPVWAQDQLPTKPPVDSADQGSGGAPANQVTSGSATDQGTDPADRSSHESADE